MLTNPPNGIVARPNREMPKLNIIWESHMTGDTGFRLTRQRLSVGFSRLPKGCMPKHNTMLRSPMDKAMESPWIGLGLSDGLSSRTEEATPRLKRFAVWSFSR